MPEPISMPQLSAAPAAAGAASAVDQRSAEANPFDAMFQAGLAKGGNPGGQAAPERPRPAGDDSAEPSNAKPAASTDATDAANDPLITLLAYGASDITAALLASAPGDPAAPRRAVPANKGTMETGTDKAVQTAPAAASLRTGATPAAATALLDPASVIKTAANVPAASAEPRLPDQDTVTDRSAPEADPTFAAQALEPAIPPVAAPAAGMEPAVAAGNAGAAAAAAVPADARRLKPEVSRTAETAALRSGPVADAPAKPADEAAAKQDRLQQRRSDTQGADPAAAVQRPEEKFAHVLNVQEPKAAERQPDASPRLDTIARTDAAPRADAAPAVAPRPASVPLVSIEPSLGSSHWNQEFVSQVNLLVSHREPQAEIRINPPHLGPVEVRIGLDGNQVSVAFSAAQPETRAAIENALPQLREMFTDNGLSLGNASVNSESSQQNPARPETSGAMRFSRGDVSEAEGASPVRAAIMRLVDTFA